MLGNVKRRTFRKWLIISAILLSLCIALSIIKGVNFVQLTSMVGAMVLVTNKILSPLVAILGALYGRHLG